jgi:hypothetical protein
MLRAGHKLRFTPDEIEGFRKLGFDFDGARTQDERWTDTLNNERPDLLDRIATELARTKGVQLPARLTRVR